jgi:hypothetical protein
MAMTSTSRRLGGPGAKNPYSYDTVGSREHQSSLIDVMKLGDHERRAGPNSAAPPTSTSSAARTVIPKLGMTGSSWRAGVRPIAYGLQNHHTKRPWPGSACCS